MTYERRQVGMWLFLVVGVIATIPTTVAAIEHRPEIVVLCWLGVTALMTTFGWLTVRVSDEGVNLRFGIGLVRRCIPYERIRAVSEVRNRWWYGWGIRLTPHGWLWNIAGLDAVELELASGKRFRIGSADPRGLRKAISAHLDTE